MLLLLVCCTFFLCSLCIFSVFFFLFPYIRTYISFKKNFVSQWFFGWCAIHLQSYTASYNLCEFGYVFVYQSFSVVSLSTYRCVQWCRMCKNETNIHKHSQWQRATQHHTKAAAIINTAKQPQHTKNLVYLHLVIVIF